MTSDPYSWSDGPAYDRAMKAVWADPYQHRKILAHRAQCSKWTIWRARRYLIDHGQLAPSHGKRGPSAVIASARREILKDPHALRAVLAERAHCSVQVIWQARKQLIAEGLVEAARGGRPRRGCKR